jgi:hypothetical protein
MISKIKQITQKSFSFGFSDTLSVSHPLYILANKIFWSTFEDEFSELYCSDNGRPAKPICLMVGLMILKHIRNVSDESIVEQWSENVYYQYFCGLEMFDSFSFTHFWGEYRKNHILQLFSRIFNPFFNLFQLFRFEHNFRISQNQFLMVD